MPACLGSGLQKVCNAIKTGGVSALYLTDRTNILSITQDVDGKVTGITMAALTYFYKFEFKSNATQFLEAFTNEGGLQVTQTLTEVWESFDQIQRNLLMDMSKCNCGMSAIHTENTGKSWFWGFKDTEEIQLFSGDRDSGTAKSDPNQVTPVLQALATEFANEFTGVVPVAP
jgi:hypothetical protein